jgi:membrane protease YdiL (CAAX protease family)
MTEEIPLAELVPAPSPDGHPLVAWLVILTLVALTIVVQRGPEKAIDPAAADELQRSILEIQGKYLVAAAQTPAMQKTQLYQSVQSLDSGPVVQRLAFVVLAGELRGFDEALRQLAATRKFLEQSGTAVSGANQRTLGVLEHLYRDYRASKWKAPSVPLADRKHLISELGWFGSLALAPDGVRAATGGQEARSEVVSAAWKAFVFVLMASIVFLCVGAAGLAGATMFIVFALSGRLVRKGGARSGNSGLYIETFAVWMVLLTALSLAAIFIPHARDHRLFYSGAASLLSLAAIAWPVLRGLSWSSVRHDIGWYRPGPAWREVLWGVVCYASSLPLIACGFAITLLLLQMQHAITGAPGGLESQSAPAHPVIEWVSKGGMGDRLAVMLLACVIAPLVEESVFRGALYRYLRDTTWKWRTGAGIAFSAFTNSLIFAVIHPQGLFAAPVLMSIAVGFSLAREWRGSLLTPITMHAINNGVMLIMLFSLI